MPPLIIDNRATLPPFFVKSRRWFRITHSIFSFKRIKERWTLIFGVPIAESSGHGYIGSNLHLLAVTVIELLAIIDNVKSHVLSCNHPVKDLILLP